MECKLQTAKYKPYWIGVLSPLKGRVIDATQTGFYRDRPPSSMLLLPLLEPAGLAMLEF